MLDGRAVPANDSAAPDRARFGPTRVTPHRWA